MQINQLTQLHMVIGYPLQHTQSPLLHNTIYEAKGINAKLLAFEHQDISVLIQAIKTLSVGLTAVTIPFKEKILDYLDEKSEEVNAIGAANTIIQTEGALKGYNTDVDGIAYALREYSISDKTVLVLGAGGAARALGHYLQQQSANILWLNRTKRKADLLAKDFGGKVIDGVERISDVNIIINTTPIGMYPQIDHTPLPDYPFKKQQVVFDVVYNPIDTLLLKQAKVAGASIISGLEMFIGQGLAQVELLFKNDKGYTEIQSGEKNANAAELLKRLRKTL